MDEISLVSWSSDQVDKSKSTCPLRFSSMCGTCEWKQRSNKKMGRSSGRIQAVSFVQRTIRNRRRTDGIRVEYFPRIFVIADSSRDPSRFEKKEHRTWRVQGTDHLHVNQCSTTSIGQREKNDEICISNGEKIKDHEMIFLQGHWSFFGSWVEKEKWYGESSYHPNAEWDSAANKMVQLFKETGHPVLKCISACRLNGWLLVSGWVTSIDAHSHWYLRRCGHWGSVVNNAHGKNKFSGSANWAQVTPMQRSLTSTCRLSGSSSVALDWVSQWWGAFRVLTVRWTPGSCIRNRLLFQPHSAASRSSRPQLIPDILRTTVICGRQNSRKLSCSPSCASWHPCASWRVLSAIPSRESASWATSFRILDVGTGQCVCAFKFSATQRSMHMDLLTAHIKFCRFWAKCLDGVLRGLTVRQPLGTCTRSSPSSSHPRRLHAADNSELRVSSAPPGVGRAPAASTSHAPQGDRQAAAVDEGPFWQYEFAR